MLTWRLDVSVATLVPCVWRLCLRRRCGEENIFYHVISRKIFCVNVSELHSEKRTYSYCTLLHLLDVHCYL